MTKDERLADLHGLQASADNTQLVQPAHPRPRLHWALASAYRLNALFAVPILRQILFAETLFFEKEQDGYRFAFLLGLEKSAFGEGELELGLQVDGQIVYTLQFTIVPGWVAKSDAADVVLISRLQGRSGCFEEIRAATKAFHDIAPPALLLAVVHGIAQLGGIESPPSPRKIVAPRHPIFRCSSHHPLAYHGRMRRPSFPAVLPLLAVALVAPCVYPQAMPGMNMADMQPVPPPDRFPVPIKMTGIGNSHIAVKASPEAQAWFDQGLSLLHDFWDYESAKAFQQAIRVDPNCAMCYWGLAQALEMRGDDAVKPYIHAALEQAERLKSHASATDKLYIDAAEAEFNAKDGDHSAATAILRKLVKKAPHDIQARIFLAQAVGDGFDENGEPKAGQKERIAILEQILREAPSDSAANHYWIHAMEPSNHPERAIPSAALLAGLAPASGHMVHMPGHIYYRVGDYAQAEHWFAASTTADETYLHQQHVSVDDDWNYVHNMMYAIANLMEEGKLTQANALSDHLGDARGQLSATLYIWSARDQMSRVNPRLPVALRTADWGAVLALVSQANLPDTSKTENLRFLASELSNFAGGMKALESGDVPAAQAESDQMDATLWRSKRASDAADEAKKKLEDAAKKDTATPPKPSAEPITPDAVAGPLFKALSIASLELHASVLVAQGRLEQGKKEFASAIVEEKKAGYREPPFYIRPVAENEALALIRAKDYTGAKAAYEDALKERPNSGFALYGLARVRELSGDTAGAREAYATFLKAWSSADSSLPEIAHAHQVVGEASVAMR